MGILTAFGSTLLGFLFAYTVVRCEIPFKGLVHALTLLPTISPPFAIALSTILLFGRAGFVTRDILGMRFGPGINDIYGLDGIIFCQIITFFAIAYLIMRGLLERIDPSMEEAALSLGASKWHIFRTVTLPLLTPWDCRFVLVDVCRIARRFGQSNFDWRQHYRAVHADLDCH